MAERTDARRKRRIRIRQACEPCRRRRRKCDGAFPCGQCQIYEYDCQFLSQRQRRQTLTEDTQSRDVLQTRATFDQEAQKQYANQGGDEPGSLAELQDATLEPPSRNSSPPQNESAARPVVNLSKGRFCNAYSGVAFVTTLATNMGLDVNLRLHSYGYNASIRPEPFATILPAARHYLSLQEATSHARVFFDVVDPVYHFLGREQFLERCTSFWSSPVATLDDFEALIAGVVCLGSFFSSVPLTVERQLFEHLIAVLDHHLTCSPGNLSLEQAGAWVLRTLYLRLTTRPLLAWIASSTAVHVAEAIALHIDVSQARVLAAEGRVSVIPDVETTRRNVYECAVFLNTYISAEYGRSRVVLDGASPRPPREFSVLGRLAELFHKMEDKGQSVESRLEILHALSNIPADTATLRAIKADITMHLFRRQVVQAGKNHHSRERRLALAMIKEGLVAARELIARGQAWWHIALTPFHATCVLLAMDTDTAFRLVPDALSVLDEAALRMHSHLPTEAAAVAQSLVKAVQKKKSEQAQMLSTGGNLDEPQQYMSFDFQDGAASSVANHGLPTDAIFDPLDPGSIDMTDWFVDFPVDQNSNAPTVA